MPLRSLKNHCYHIRAKGGVVVADADDDAGADAGLVFVFFVERGKPLG